MVSVDDIELNTKFAKEHDADFPILSDPQKTTAEAYGVLGTTGFARRWTFYIGPDGKVLHVDTTPGTANAGENLARKLAELGVKKR